ncbi:unnamed protein product [Linum trigynum]|uniref:High mobility group B protein 15-like n=1 Tax=Linum trigynum TaxID=586398 RepID=A0AAV2CFH2_9ROSI
MASSSCAKQIPVVSTYIRYPAAMAEYEEVKNNPKLFMATLEKFHSTMGTKFMIPIIGGRELDLHRLFVEVTQRGGLQKILGEKRWKDVTATFNFPSTATNASYVLRKYYMSLLQHYEQLYFFKAHGWNAAAAAAAAAPPQNSLGGHFAVQFPVHPLPGYRPPAAAAIQQQQQINVAHQAPGAKAASAAAVGTPAVAVGVIDGKFDSGYLVTVVVGGEKLQGVLYQATTDQGQQQHCQMLQQQQQQNQQNYYSLLANANNSNVAVDGVVVHRRRRRRKKNEIKRRDPDHPKPNRSGYNFFFAEQHARLKPLLPGKDREISRMIGELWNKLKDGERSVYQEIAMKDKERYRSEMEGYRERLRIRGEQSLVLGQTVVPLLAQQWQQQPHDMVEANDLRPAGNGEGGRESPHHELDNESCSSSSGREVGSDDEEEDDDDDDNKDDMAGDFDMREATSCPVQGLDPILSKLGMEGASSALEPFNSNRVVVIGEEKTTTEAGSQSVNRKAGEDTTKDGNNNMQNSSTEANQDGVP